MLFNITINRLIVNSLIATDVSSVSYSFLVYFAKPRPKMHVSVVQYNL